MGVKVLDPQATNIICGVALFPTNKASVRSCMSLSCPKESMPSLVDLLDGGWWYIESRHGVDQLTI